MSKFFDDEREVDYGVEKYYNDHKPQPPKLPESKNGGVSNEAYLNDYRNRMPFHYIEEGTDGYYYWQYGATMEILFEITDEVALTDPVQEYVTDVRENGQTIVDRETGVANIILGSMAKENVEDYYTAEQTMALFSKLMAVITQIQEVSSDNKQQIFNLWQYVFKLVAENNQLKSVLANLSEQSTQLRQQLADLSQQFADYKEKTDAAIEELKYGKFYEDGVILRGGSANKVPVDLIHGGSASKVGEVIYYGQGASLAN